VEFPRPNYEYLLRTQIRTLRDAARTTMLNGVRCQDNWSGIKRTEEELCTSEAVNLNLKMSWSFREQSIYVVSSVPRSMIVCSQNFSKRRIWLCIIGATVFHRNTNSIWTVNIDVVKLTLLIWRYSQIPLNHNYYYSYLHVVHRLPTLYLK